MRVIRRRREPVTVAADFAVYDGYASMNEYMVRGMARAGARVSPWPLRFHQESLSQEFLTLLATACPHLDGPVVASGNRHSQLGCIVGPDLFVRQAWETSRFPAEWVPTLNRSHAVIATSVFVADALRASGVEVPIEVVPDGVDPDVYPYQLRPERETLTTLIVGRTYDRKHYPEAIAAWQQAFADDRAARLIIRAAESAPWRFASIDDPRVQVIKTVDPKRGLADWYRDADVLLALGSEGTGLPMLEAMATGLPVVALASEGQGDVCSAAPDALLPVRATHRRECYQPGLGMSGLCGVPDVAEAAAHLRWVADHRADAADMGRRASEWMHQHRNVWNYGPDVLDVIATHS